MNFIVSFFFGAFFIMIFVAITIILASAKKRNVFIWALASVGGFILFFIFTRIISNIVFYRMDYFGYSIMGNMRYSFFNIVSTIIRLFPFVYEIGLIFILLVIPTKNNQQNLNKKSTTYPKCNHCETIVQPDMRYCPYCGNQL